MFNQNDILARLQNGEDASVIAEEMAAALNGAIDAHNYEMCQNEVDASLEVAAEALTDYIANKYPALLDVMELSPEMLKEIVDTIAEVTMPLMPLLSALKNEDDCDCHCECCTCDSTTPVDPIANVLIYMGLMQ